MYFQCFLKIKTTMNALGGKKKSKIRNPVYFATSVYLLKHFNALTLHKAEAYFYSFNFL